MVHMFHSFTHFRRKSTVRNSMVIFCFPFRQKQRHQRASSTKLLRPKEKKPEKSAFDVLCGMKFCLSKRCLCLPNDGRRSFLLCPTHKWTENEFKSDKFQRRSLCHLCFNSSVQYDLWNQLFFLFTSSALKSDTHLTLMITKWTKQWTIAYRKSLQSLTIFDGFLVVKRRRRLTTPEKSHEYFRFLWFFRQWNCTLI